MTDVASVDAFSQAVPECSVLINSAGGALGLEPIAQADEAHWQAMYDSNVLGTLRMTEPFAQAHCIRRRYRAHHRLGRCV